MSPSYLEKGKNYSFKGRKTPIKFLYQCPWAAIRYPKYVFEGTNGGRIELSPNAVHKQVFEVSQED